METLKDLLEEAKRRTILVGVLVLIVAYIMSLTSSSVWINLPVSIIVLAALRRLSFEVDIRWKPHTRDIPSRNLPHLHRRQLTNYDPLLSGPSQMAPNRWRHNINSPAVEAAVDELTRCVINEWVTNLWYSSITPDQEAPEELRILINGVIAEVAQRAKRVNLITLLSRDMVDLVGTQFELYRRMKAKIGPDIIGSLSTEERDVNLKHAMMSSRELHPALVSPEAEYKVLKKLTGGVVALVLKRQDSHCRLLRTLARELLACAVLRPVLNFASPGFINELIESLAVASNEKATDSSTQRVPDRIHKRKSSVTGLEMIPLGTPEARRSGSGSNPIQNDSVTILDPEGGAGASIKSQLPVEATPSNEVKSSEQMEFDDQRVWGPLPQGDWAQVLDAVAERRVQALTPEHLDNLWAKGRNYKKRESEKAGTTVAIAKNVKHSNVTTIPPVSTMTETLTKTVSAKEVSSTSELVIAPVSLSTSVSSVNPELTMPQKKLKIVSEQYGALLFGDSREGGNDIPGIGFSPLATPRRSPEPSDASSSNQQLLSPKGPEIGKSQSIENLVDLDKNSLLNAAASEQPTEKSKTLQKSNSGSQRLKRAVRMISHRKSKSTGGGLDGSHRLGYDLSTLLKTAEGPSGDSRLLTPEERRKNARKPKSEELCRPSLKLQSSRGAPELTPHVSLGKLQCQVMGAHFEKIGSKAFAVYTISVKDIEDRTWQVQRRFRNFEQLHRRLKDMPYYTLNLPPKRFLSSSLDNSFVRERCILLDKYLKSLLAIPSVAELHEVWDFLSVNSQHYTYGNSPSMIKALAVNVDDAMDDIVRQIRGVSDDISGALKTTTNGIRQRFPVGSGDLSQTVSIGSTEVSASLTLKLSGPTRTLSLTDSEFGERPQGTSISEDEFGGVYGGHMEESAHGYGSAGWQSDNELPVDGLDLDISKVGRYPFASGNIDNRFGSRQERALSEGHSPVDSYASDTVEDDLVIPQEWSPPKVSVPLLNLVDLIFQLQGRGWIRRQVLWMAKQILQLGMGDAIDDWLLGRIQWLRREEVVASGIQWVKGALWPDGVFVTKHPRSSPPGTSADLQESGMDFADEVQESQHRPPINSFEYRLEAARRAGVVREIILDKAPATLVNLIGKKQYTRCAKDIYYFSQSSVCVKQLAYSLLEMLLGAAFPELHDMILDARSSIA